MKYNIHYSCLSHVGLCRTVNQDNLICQGEYIPSDRDQSEVYRREGVASSGSNSLFGIFDGLGGEEQGEVASLLAAKAALDIPPYTNSPMLWLEHYCKQANENICRYMQENGVRSMGTTAAMLLFSHKEVNLCNIGDSKIFCFSEGQLREISESHVAAAPYGVKPPLLQNLGIRPTEFQIRPYFARGSYHDRDMFLLCSDGLTDMLSVQEIEEVLNQTAFPEMMDTLLEKALEHGGTDNITMILCQINQEKGRWAHLLSRRRG